MYEDSYGATMSERIDRCEGWLQCSACHKWLQPWHDKMGGTSTTGGVGCSGILHEAAFYLPTGPMDDPEKRWRSSGGKSPTFGHY